jgi:hypothetical protein
MFRLGETLATAGFICYAMDFPGHGQSSQRFNVNNTVDALNAAIHEIGPIDVFIGHSMGAGAGAFAVHSETLKPGLFIAIGAAPQFGEHSPPLVLLAGKQEEAVPLARLQAVPNARLQRFAWCDHCTEVYDPRLVNAAVAAACESVGKQPPPAPTRWCWRVLGGVLSLIGAICLGIFLPLTLPAFMRGPMVAFLCIAAFSLSTTAWLSAFPTLRRLPFYIVGILIACLLMAVRNKLRIPRWSLMIVTFTITIVLLLMGKFRILPLFIGIVTLLLLAGGILGKIAALYGSRRDGDMAMAIFVGYAFGQWIPILI